MLLKSFSPSASAEQYQVWCSASAGLLHAVTWYAAHVWELWGAIHLCCLAAEESLLDTRCGGTKKSGLICNCSTQTSKKEEEEVSGDTWMILQHLISMIFELDTSRKLKLFLTFFFFLNKCVFSSGLSTEKGEWESYPRTWQGGFRPMFQECLSAT